MTPQWHWRHGYFGGLCVGIALTCAILGKWVGFAVFLALFVGVETFCATERSRKRP